MLAVAHVLGLLLASFALKYALPIGCALLLRDGLTTRFLLAAAIDTRVLHETTTPDDAVLFDRLCPVAKDGSRRFAPMPQTVHRGNHGAVCCANHRSNVAGDGFPGQLPGCHTPFDREP